ncbi:MAG: hypothetical protein R8P61_21490 [Bacteroidia bacterium]|nr:hypothetical protein [Bacteroidia bacterium]
MEARSRIIVALVEFFERARLKYVIVGANASRIPYEVENDVDFIVDPTSFVRIIPLMQAFCKDENLHMVQVIPYEPLAKAFFLQKSHEGKMVSVQFDFASAYSQGRHMLLSGKQLLDGRRLITGSDGKLKFWVPSVANEFLYYLLKKVVKKEMNEEQFEYLKDKFAESPDASSLVLERFFNKSNQGFICLAMEGKKELIGVQKVLGGLKEDLLDHLNFNPGLMFKFYLNRLGRIFRPTGLSIAFLGADGSGKSTIIKKLQDDSPAFRKNTYFHLSPKLIYKGGPAEQASNPHGKSKRSFLFSSLKVFYLLIEYSLGWIMKVKPRLIRTHLVIFDRYYHDILIDPIRYRYGGGKFLANLIGKLIPKPDMFILLDAPAEVLQARKQEVTLQESKNARERYLEFMRSCDRGVVVNSDQDLPKVELQVRESIMQVMERKSY